MKKVFIVSALLLLGTTLFAQNQVRKITIDDAVVLAADNNISLHRQKISLELLEKRNKYSWNSVSPSLSASGSFNLPLEQDTYSYSVSGSISLSLTPSLYTAIKTAKLNYENGISSYEEAVRTVELNVRKLFYSLIYTKDSIALQNRNLETARQRYLNNKDRYNRGQLSELDLLQSQYAYESLVPNIESAVISYDNNMATFKQTLGLSQNEQIELVGSLSDAIPPESFSVDMAIEEIPSVKKLEQSIELQKTSLLATRFSAWGPSISASYSYGKSGTKGSDSLQTTGNAIALSVRIPLDGYLPWSNGALSIESQKANLADLELQLENAKTTAELTIQNSLKNIMQKQGQIEMLQQNVDIAQKAYNMTLTAYNHGSKDLMTLQNSADSLKNAQLNQQSQIYNLICAVLDLENTLGVPFGTLGDKE